MKQDILKYFYKNPDAFYEWKGQMLSHSVHGKSWVRYNKAKEQHSMKHVPDSRIIELINTFLEGLEINIVNEPIMISEGNGIADDAINSHFELKGRTDILWLKFSIDEYVGVVAKSTTKNNDINFDIPLDKESYHLKDEKGKPIYNASGILLHQLGTSWDTTKVMIFPLVNNHTGYDASEIENALGNYLADNGVPILDFYSHTY